ncbi:MAG: Rpp14/Pop5 family protein [Candidatus Bathyarchaeia archaeon]
MREKRRYLALKVDSGGNPAQKEVMDALWGSVLKLFGEYGASKVSLTLISYDFESRICIVRVANAEVEKLRAAAAAITRIGDAAASVHVICVSGTLRALREKIFKASKSL